MDIWVWIALFIVAWLIETVATAAKNRQRAQERARGTGGPPARQRAPGRRPRPPAPEPSARPSGRPRRTAPEPLVFEIPYPGRPRGPESAPRLEGVSAEVERPAPALESLEVEHHRVAERLDYENAATEGHVTKRRRLGRPASWREAVVWREILGRPKGLR